MEGASQPDHLSWEVDESDSAELLESRALELRAQIAQWLARSRRPFRAELAREGGRCRLLLEVAGRFAGPLPVASRGFGFPVDDSEIDAQLGRIIQTLERDPVASPPGQPLPEDRAEVNWCVAE